MKFTENQIPFSIGEQGVRHMAFQGKYYYFTLFGQYQILQTTTDFQQIRYITTVRIYDCLCFDPNSCTFWATVQGCCTRIFQLNQNLEEIFSLCLSDVVGSITGLSHNICQDSLWLSYPWGVISCDKVTGEIKTQQEMKGFVNSILSLCPGFIVVTRREKRQYLEIYFENGTKIKEFPLPKDISLRNILYLSCCENNYLEILYTLGACYPKISREAVTAHDLGFEPCFCHGKICEAICCPTHDQCVDEVLESIALVESSLSSILNSQGEQLQKIIEESDCLEEILCANERVNETITKVTHLEMILHNKLESLIKICQCHPSCSDSHPCISDLSQKPEID